MKKFVALLLALSVMVACFAFSASADTQLQGIDVSSHNGTVDWTAVKNAGIDFAMIRDGYGGDVGSWDDQKDTQFENNYSGATSAGVKVGAYHYSYATNVTMASQEADECLYILNGRHLDYPVAYDVENSCQYSLSADELGQIVQTFCSKIQAAGYKTMVYSFKNFFLGHLTSPLVSQYDSWVATRDLSSPGISPCSMWQYSSTTYVAGMGTGDVDYSYVDYANGGGSNTNNNNSTSSALNPLTFTCDTPSYAFGTNSVYVYKITTADTYPPTAASSNTSAVTVSGPKAVYQGYCFMLANVGAGNAVITTTAGDGRSVAFTATGTGTATSMRCDTSSYTFGTNSTYCYKITTAAASAPTAASSNPSAVSVAYAQKLSDGYLYRLSNVGAGTATITTTASDGSSVYFSASGTKSASVSPAVSTLGVSSDTPYYYTLKKGASYQYKLTGASGVSYSFACGNGAVAKTVSVQKSGGSYYVKVSGVGRGCTGLYATSGGKSQAVSIITVA